MGTLRSRLSEQSALLGQDVSCALSTKRGPPVNAFVGRYGCQCGWYRGYDVYIRPGMQETVFRDFFARAERKKPCLHGHLTNAATLRRRSQSHERRIFYHGNEKLLQRHYGKGNE